MKKRYFVLLSLIGYAVVYYILRIILSAFPFFIADGTGELQIHAVLIFTYISICMSIIFEKLK